MTPRVANNFVPLKRNEPMADEGVSRVAPALNMLVDEKLQEYSDLKAMQINARIKIGDTFFASKSKISDLKRAISNLVNNAVEASATLIDLKVVPTEDLRGVVVTVADNGKGMADTEIQRLQATVGFSTKPGGRGLGFKQVVATAGTQKNVSVSSREGAGTVVAFSVLFA